MQKGFTLLEIAIVVTIVGLIAGSIILGGNLVRSSELRSLGTQADQIEAAFMQFQGKYRAVPGDFKDATKFWGAADGADGLGTDCTTIISDGATATCNGNGNSKVQQATGDPYNYENFRLWQHLANAGMISGIYTGVNHTPSATQKEAVPGENVPAAKLSSVGFTLWYVNANPGYANWYPVNYNMHVITVGKHGTIETRDPFLTPSEMYSIDLKIDDGFPGKGRVITWMPTLMPDCASSADPVTAVYLTPALEKDDSCSFLVKLQR